jgi:hypothetical protein
MPTQQIGKYSNISASTDAIKTGNGTLYGIIVNSHTNGTIKIYDAITQTSTVIMNTFSFPAGSGVYMFGPGVSFYTGLSVTIGGTADVTLLYF